MEEVAPVGADGSGSRPLRSRQEAELFVVGAVQQNAERLLRAAQRWTGCPEDAQDAYQRTLEIFVKRSTRLREEDVARWLSTTCKYEALAVRRQRTDEGRLEELDAEVHYARELSTPEERVVDGENVARAAEALGTLKPQEVQALWHKALGKTYAEIGEELGWTYTKVNRCIAEGRRTLAATVERIESGAECERFGPMLSALLDGEVSRDERSRVRRHLRACPGCRAQARALQRSRCTMAALLPPVAVPVSGATPDDALGLVSRIAEGFLQFVGERATMSALKLQSAAELIGGGKVAAVAASAAAVAGGGAVVADEVTRRDAAPARAEQGIARPEPRAARPVARVASPTAARRSSPAASRTGPAAEQAARRASRVGEFGASRAAARHEFTSGRRARAASSSRSGEFSAGARTASAGATPAPTSAAPTPRATVSPERPAAPQAGPEFGL